MSSIALWIQQFCPGRKLFSTVSHLWPNSVSARTIQPHFVRASVRERDIWGRERGWGKYCTALQCCGYSVETRADFGGFIELFTKKKGR